MKVAIMQPYFFPYIGYFQLIHAVDKFIVYDDVNYIKGGWINRNYIFSQGNKQRITLEVIGSSSNVQINQIRTGGNKSKLLKTIQQNYSKASEYQLTFPIIEEIIMNEETNLAVYLENSLKKVCTYLDICPEWFMSSDLIKDNSLKGQDKIISICKAVDATEYINLSGGLELYKHEAFSQNGIKLSFIHSNNISQKNSIEKIKSNLSIIDTMLFNNPKKCKRMLENYTLD